MPAYKDMMGDEVVLHAPPKRIVSLVPSQTELLHSLGFEDEVVGITKFCIHPGDWFRTKARVGGTKSVKASVVEALKPDLIIANKEENVHEQVGALREIAPVWVSDIRNLEDALTMIENVGLLCGKAPEAQQIAARISADFATLHPGALTRKNTSYCIWRNPWMWAGGDTFITDILQRAGLHNALHVLDRYPEVTLEGLRKYDPDLVLLSSEPYPFKEKHLAEVSAALPEAKVLLVDGELFSWYGSRLLRTVPYLKSLLEQIHE